ncbi:MAG: hypothetical protein ACTHNV_10660 [Ralstonia sp.]|uniref:hypothetical protein n=1 Tax=Ralstonia sp. TaxID=54061 RepID=UPI003F7F1E27
MADALDAVARYGAALGLTVRSRTILVEGTTDAELFEFASRMEYEVTGMDLLGQELAFVAAGERDRGGTHGVIRELIALRGMARTCLSSDGRPRYRFIGLLDNDNAGRQAVKLARTIDNSILEYKDVYRLWPVMPSPGNLDPGSVQRAFERENAGYKGLDWEMEDLLPTTFVDAFISEYPQAVTRASEINGKLHRDFTADGKARFHRFIKLNALYADLKGVIETLRAIRHCLGLPAPQLGRAAPSTDKAPS